MSDASSWRTNNVTVWNDPATGVGARVELDMGASLRTFRAFGLFGTNLTVAAKVRWLLFNNASPPGVIYNSNPSFEIDNSQLAGVRPGIQQHVHVLPRAAHPNGIVARWCRADIQDPTNPDGYISVAGAYMGDLWTPRLNLTPNGTGISHERESTIVTSRSGTQYVTPHYLLRGWEISHDNLDETDIWSQLWPLDQASHIGNNILFVPNSDSPNMQSEAVFGLFRITSNIAFDVPSGKFRSWRAKIVERG